MDDDADAAVAQLGAGADLRLGREVGAEQVTSESCHQARSNGMTPDVKQVRGALKRECIEHGSRLRARSRRVRVVGNLVYDKPKKARASGSGGRTNRRDASPMRA